MWFLTLPGGLILYSKLSSLWSCSRPSLSFLSGWILGGHRFPWRLLLREGALCSGTQEEFQKSNLIKRHWYWPHHYLCGLEALCLLIKSWSIRPLPGYFWYAREAPHIKPLVCKFPLVENKKKNCVQIFPELSFNMELSEIPLKAIFKNSGTREYYLMTDLWYLREAGNYGVWERGSR